MNKSEYLSNLKSSLSALPERECESIIRYYDSLISDVGTDNEQTMMASLGSPQSLARAIINKKNTAVMRRRSRNAENAAAKKMPPVKTSSERVIFLIVTFPIWGAVFIVFAAAILALLLVSVSVLSAMFAAGIILLCMGIAYAVNILSVGLVMIGLGIAMCGIVFLLFMPAIRLVVYLIKAIIRTYILFFKKIIRKADKTS